MDSRLISRLRKLGLKCRIFEREWRSGGVWVPNNYPGMSISSQFPPFPTHVDPPALSRSAESDMCMAGTIKLTIRRSSRLRCPTIPIIR
jgi:cation diffusion facilitator CzcD-associated flavoprotein CzcO